MRQRYVTGILRYVVRPAADDNHLRVQVQHVGPEAYEHLRGGLPADAAAHITVCRKKIGMRLDPQFGDRVAHEDDLRIAHLVVGLFETAEVRPVLGLRSIEVPMRIRNVTSFWWLLLEHMKYSWTMA